MGIFLTVTVNFCSDSDALSRGVKRMFLCAFTVKVLCKRTRSVMLFSWACKSFHHFVLHWYHCSAKKVTSWNTEKLGYKWGFLKSNWVCMKEFKTAASPTGNGFIKSGFTSWVLGIWVSYWHYGREVLETSLIVFCLH